MNDSISADAELVTAGLKATQSGGTITLASTNNSYFRVNAGVGPKPPRISDSEWPAQALPGRP